MKREGVFVNKLWIGYFVKCCYFFLLKDKFIVTSHGDNCPNKGNNVDIT